MTIPLFRPSCTEEEIEAVTRVLRSGWWGQGPETAAFEEEFAACTGTRYAVAVSSGTAALELAARATGLTGGVAVVPALTFVSTALAMQHAGSRVVFADIDEDTLCLDWTSVWDMLWPVTQRNSNKVQHVGVVPVWYGGTVRDIPPLLSRGITVIEDCAHAAGSYRAGLQGTGCWSFHAVKNLATGDGGMVTTDDSAVAERVRQLRWCGIDRSTWDRDAGKYGWEYEISRDGEKAHMNDITAALGRVQLRRLDEMNYKRWTIAHRYSRNFSSLGWARTAALDSGSSNHLYVLRVQDRNRFVDYLLANGVSAGVHYKPLTHYPHLFPGEHYVPVTERVWQTLVTLPLFPDMTDGEIEQVIAAVRSFPA